MGQAIWYLILLVLYSFCHILFQASVSLSVKGGWLPAPLQLKVRKPLKTQSAPKPLLQTPQAASPPAPPSASEAAPAMGPALPQQICSLILCEPDHQGCTGLTPGSRVCVWQRPWPSESEQKTFPLPPHSHSLVTASGGPPGAGAPVLPYLSPLPAPLALRCWH